MAEYRSEAITGDGTLSVVTATDTTVLAANSGRLEFTIVNDSDTTIYLALGATAAASKGIRLNASGGSYTSDKYRGEVSAYHAGGTNKVLTYVEI